MVYFEKKPCKYVNYLRGNTYYSNLKQVNNYTKKIHDVGSKRLILAFKQKRENKTQGKNKTC